MDFFGDESRAALGFLSLEQLKETSSHTRQLRSLFAMHQALSGEIENLKNYARTAAGRILNLEAKVLQLETAVSELRAEIPLRRHGKSRA